MPGIHVGAQVGALATAGDVSTRVLSVSELSAAQYNAAFVDDTGAAITTTAAELNILDGATVTAAELNKIDASVADVYADGLNQPRWAQATWDFAVDGGAISAIDLGITIPTNSIIVGGVLDVQTTCTSATDVGTGAISVEGANDIVTAVAIGTGTPWDQGFRVIIPKWTAATFVKTTAARAITFTIAVEAFTASKFTISLAYIPTLVNV